MARKSSAPELRSRTPYDSLALQPVWRVVFALLLAVLFASSTPASAQSDSDLRVYLDVLSKFQQGDVLELERYTSAAAPGYLRTQAMQLLAWEYRRMGDSARADKWANDVLSVQPDNAIALAVLADSNHALTQTSPAEPGADRALSMAKRALRNLGQLKPIEGLSESAFAAIKTDLERSLNGAIGYAYYQRKDYVTARTYLRKSVALAPDNAQYIYALAIADLYGDPPDASEGYQMLARSVNLSQGTPAGAELARFARERYKEEGGKSADWDKFLAAATVPPRITQPQAQPTAVAEQRAAKPGEAPQRTSSAEPQTGAVPSPAEGSEQQPGAIGAQSSSEKSVASVPEPATVEVAKNTPPPLPPRPVRKIAPPGTALSIGILIETAATSKETRRAVVNSMSDMVRHLRQQDEAFVVSFSNEIVFEQDLTSNSDALESAMDNIKPMEGTALFDAVGFAAGHLSRIARNGKKVLIVISDGSNQTNRISPLELSGELNVSGVEIYCIGLGADTVENQHRLRALADRTGGRAMITAGADQFRSATQQVAQSIGIPF